MAIRPVDLQLAYLAAPQSAAVVSNAQEAPQAAQQAAASAFAAEVTKREESVDEPQKVHGQKVGPRDEREAERQDQRGGRRRQEPEEEEVAPASPLGLTGEGEHFIDVTV